MLTLTRTFIRTIRQQSEADYRAQLQQVGFPKKRIDDMAAGFNDGMTAFLQHLVAAELVTVQAEEG